jgi:hypothetical protein
MNRFAALCMLVASIASAQDARQIVAESENRSRSKSQQYEGTLEVIGASNKISIKRWEYRRIGSYGTSKAILRFTAPAEVKGVALLIVNHTDRASDQWACWKIESKPKESKTSQYTSSLVWVRKDNYVVAQIEGYAKDKLVRRIHYSDIQNVSGIWTPRTLEVYDAGRKSRTVLKLEKLQYDLPMKDEDFTIEALRRG